MTNSDYHYMARQGCIPLRNALIVFVIICFSLTFPGMAFVPTANATELTMGEEALPIYSKEDLQNVLNNIKGKLDAGFPATTELIFLEDIRNELKRQLAEVEMQIEEDLADMPDIPGAEFNTDFSDGLDSAKRMINMLDNIIISPSIEEIDSALELMKVLEPEVQGEILAAQPEFVALPNRVVNKTTAVFETPPLDYVGAEVTDADLAETDEVVFTDRVREKVEELHKNFVHIVSWATLNIKNEFYPRSMKTADKVLVDGAGSVLDICTLLVTFFRIKGTPAKYIRGYKKLTIEQLMNWTGGLNAEAAIAVLEENNNPTVERIYNDTGELESVVIDHVYVAFYGPKGQWVIVDPAFKEYIDVEGSGFDINDETLVAIEETVTFLNDAKTRASVNHVDLTDIFDEQVANYENNVGHIDEVVGKREIFAAQKIVPPTYLAHGLGINEHYVEEFSAIPEHMQTKFRVKMSGVTAYETTVANIAGKTISLTYVAAHSGAQSIIDHYNGNLFAIPLWYYVVDMMPVLQIDGEPVAYGASYRLGYSGGSVQTWFLRPGNNGSSEPVWEYVNNKPLTTGNKYILFVPTQKTSMEELKRLAEETQAEIIERGLTEGIVPDDLIIRSLYFAVMFYFGAKDVFTDHAARSANVVLTNHMSLGYICDEIRSVYGFYYNWGLKRGLLRVKKAGVHIDVVRNAVKPVSTTGNDEDEKKCMGSCGWISTGMEHALMNLAFRSPAASTAMLFAEAVKRRIPLRIITKDTLEADLAQLKSQMWSGTYWHIYNAVNAGYTAIVPEAFITLEGSNGEIWKGNGWQIFDPATNGGGYMICGGIVSYGASNDYINVINGGSTASIIDHPLSKVELFLHILVLGVGPISVGLGHMAMADMVYATILTYGGFALGAPFALALNALGAALIVAGLVGFVWVYSSFFSMIINSRKRRVYVV